MASKRKPDALQQTNGFETQKKNNVFNFSLNFKYLKRLHATGRLEIGRSNLDISMSTFELRLTFEFLTFKVVHSCM